jgi:mannitol-specific phosphotransferase system IIBC component
MTVREDNSRLGIIVAIVTIVSVIISAALAVGMRASEIDNLKTKTEQLEERKVDKAVYDIDIKYIKQGIDDIKESLKKKDQ